eukprot:COSAG01_NODE_24480_length_777_cov_1.470501_1_plen_31_part_01
MHAQPPSAIAALGAAAAPPHAATAVDACAGP